MPFFNWFSFRKVVPKISAQEAEEEELVDPQVTLRQECEPGCLKLKDKLDQCNDRVNSRTQTAETCVEELFDFVHCVDHCVAKTLFSKLK